MTEPQFISAAEMIRQLASSRGTDYEITSHCEKEMLADGIDVLDLRNALINCESAEEQIVDGAVRYLARGRDTEERMISVVVEIDEFTFYICVVTTWRGMRK